MVKLNDFEFTGDFSLEDKDGDDSATPQNLNVMILARSDGGKLISSNYTPREIKIRGLIRGDSMEDLELNIDSLKKNCSVTNGHLDVDYAGGTRRFVVNTTTIIISRKSYNITFAPYEVVLEVIDPPFGQEVSGGVLSYMEAFSANDITSDSVQNSFTCDGSAQPKPTIRYFFDKQGDINQFDFANLSTSKQMSVATAFTVGDEIIIDNSKLSVSRNGEPMNFSGVFPDFKVGSNSFLSNFYGTGGTTVEASQTINNFYKPLYGTIKLAQSFTVSTACLMPKIQLLLNRIGTITSDISVRIETNTSGHPSGTAVTNGTSTISASNIANESFWIASNFSDCNLATSTTYWIVLSTTGGDSYNHYEWKMNSAGGYANGNASKYVGSWYSFSSDFCFKVYKNIVDQNNSTETAESFNETFTGTTYKDAGATTANWSTSLVRLQLKLDNGTVTESHYTGSNDFYFGKVNDHAQIGHFFNSTPGTGAYLKKVIVKIKKQGSPTSDISMIISSSSSGKPANDVLATSTNVINGSSLSSSYQDAVFYFNDYYIGHYDTRTFRIVTSTTSNTDYYYILNDSSWSGYGTYYYDTSWNAAFNNTPYCEVTTSTTYDTTNNIGQSLAVDSVSSVIASATITATQTLPASCSIAESLSSDGTNFENCTLGTEHYFTNIGSALKFKETLTGTSTATPYTDDLTISYKLATILNATTQRVAQSFVSGFTGTLGRIQLNVKKFGTPGEMTIAIFSDSGGNPNASLASQTVSATDVQGSQLGWITVNFSSGASLTSGTTYWIVVSAAGVDASNGYLIRSRAGNTYANGTLKYSTNSGGAYSEYANEDLLFKTYQTAGDQHIIDLSIKYCKRYL